MVENPAIKKILKSQGLYFLPEREILDYIELPILNSCSALNGSDLVVNDPTASWKSTGHIIMGLRSEVPLDDPNCQSSWRRDRRMGMYHNIPKGAVADSSSANSNALKPYFSRAADDPDILLEMMHYLHDKHMLSGCLHERNRAFR